MDNLELEIKEYQGPGYKAQIDFSEWRVAIANYMPSLEEDRLTYLERHLETDEVFILLEGNAGLLIGREKKRYIMEKGKLYNVKQGVWHRVFMTENSKVVIVENSDTGNENTEYIKW